MVERVVQQVPGGEGVPFAARVRDVFPERRLPLVLVSALPPEQARRSEAGNLVDAFLARPLQHEALAELLPQLLSGETGPSPAGGDLPLSERYPLRLLVAEDNQVNQLLVRKVLAKLGYDCDLVANGIEAVEACARKSYDLVLMDIQMPEMDGVEATVRIQAASREAEDEPPLVIALTANVLPEDRKLYMERGMLDMVPKPYSLNNLRAAIEKAGPLARRRRMRAA